MTDDDVVVVGVGGAAAVSDGDCTSVLLVAVLGLSCL